MSRHALTFTDVCLTLAFVAMLAAMLIPVQRAILVPADTKRCSNNLKQILLAEVTYANEQDGLFPVCLRNDKGGVDGIDVHGTAIASLEFLSAYHRNEMGPSSFRCPDLAGSGPVGKANDELSFLAGDSTWARATLAGTATGAVAYAYDWGVPANARATRVVLADRGHANHRDRVVVAYADGHTKTLLRATDSATTGATVDGLANVDGSSWHGVYVNGEAGLDNIFSSLDDPAAAAGPDGLLNGLSNQRPVENLAGRGDTTRACVR